MIKKFHLLKACPGILLSVFMLLATQVWAPACGLHEDNTYPSCHYAQMVILALGILILGTVLMLMFSKDSRSLSVIILGEAVLMLLIPKVIIPLCKMSSMKCLKNFYPIVILFGVFFILYALILFGMSFIKPRRKREA